MPELPEVETVRRDLEPHLVGQRVERVQVFWPSIVQGVDIEAFRQRIEGRTFTEVGRRGKYLCLALDDGQTLLLHLRMTGRLFYQSQDYEKTSKHLRLFFALADGGALYFEDARKFGVAALKRAGETSPLSGFEKLGIEPLSEEFTPARLFPLLQKSRRPVKAFLLDQTKIAGIGNIYADEALFRANIYPLQRAKDCSMDEVARLCEGIQQVLNEAIEDGGTTFRDYVNGEGEKGNHQEHLYVYQREGQPCLACGTTIQKTTLIGRSTHFCPHCQLMHDPEIFVLGLTGGIATGKSTMSRRLQSWGAYVIDADRLARDMSEPHQPIWEKYCEHYGEEILNPNKQINRKEIASRLFGHPEELDWVKKEIHPLLEQAMLAELAKAKAEGHKMFCIDAPLLFEARWSRFVNRTWVMLLPIQLQVLRLTRRDRCSKEQALERINSQMRVQVRAARADLLVRNYGKRMEADFKTAEETWAAWKKEVLERA